MTKPIDPQSAIETMWKTIPDWPEYEVSEYGHVRRVLAASGATVGKTLKQQWLPNGYAKVSLCRDSKRREYLVHRLVAAAFIGDIPAGMDVCHNDGDKANNHFSNLRIDTRKGNMADQIVAGKTPRGERSGTNKYSRHLVRFVRDGIKNGLSVRGMSQLLEMPESTIYSMQSGQTWGWL